MAQRRAADARWKIDGILYAVKRFRRSGRANPIDVSNSEGVPGNPAQPAALGTSACIGDLPEGQFQLVSATFDDAANPFAAPLVLIENSYHTLQHYPAGIAGPAAAAFNALLVEVVSEGQIPGAQPVTLTFQSDGAYLYPT